MKNNQAILDEFTRRKMETINCLKHFCQLFFPRKHRNNEKKKRMKN